MATTKIPDNDTADCVLTLLDEGNFPITPAAAPTWGVADNTLASITAAANGLSAQLKPLKSSGASQVTVSGDNWTGTGDFEIDPTAAAGAMIAITVNAAPAPAPTPPAPPASGTHRGQQHK